MCCTLFHCLCTYKATISNNGIIQMQVFVATRNKPEFFVHESKVACHVLNTYLLCCSVGKATISNNGIIQMQVFVATRNKPEFFVHESKVACHVLNTYLLCCSVGKGFLVCLWVCE